MHPMHNRTWFTLGAAMVAAAVCVPGAAFADTSSQLPKGYTSDEIPTPPASTASPVRPASDTTTQDEYSDTDPSAVTEFQQPLSPYGVWVVDANYGTVWVPNATVVGADFAPYQTAGHWALDDDGEWLWVSDYDWGYIPFHYGRWVWVSGRGWAWIPGRTYAPAWVVWRTGDEGYIGWAPMPPAYYWSDGVAVSLWVIPPAPYVFCSTTYVFSPHVHTYVIHDHASVQQAARRTHPYKPANPTGGTSHKAADPSGSSSGARRAASPGSPASSPAPGGSYSHRAASPSLQEAHVPANAVPKARVAPDSKAIAYAHRSTSPHASSAGPNRFNAGSGQSRRGSFEATSPPSGGAAGHADPIVRTPRGDRGGFAPSQPSPPARSASPSGPGPSSGSFHAEGRPSAPVTRGPAAVHAPSAPRAAPKSAPAPRATSRGVHRK